MKQRAVLTPQITACKRKDIDMNGFICPVCGKSLEIKEKSYVCDDRHSFDISSKGYVNLLLSGQMNAKLPGDNKMMVNARTEFLSKGYYSHLAQAVCDAVCVHFHGGVLLDAGCGEGWYDRCIAKQFEEANLPLELAGFDIAKPAVRLAAKALPSARYAVASSFHQPVRTGWADVLLNCFSPFAQEEFLRVLRPGGRLIYAVPGAEHLFQMKAVLYEKPYKNPVQEVAYPGFEAIGEREVSGSITVPAGQLEALFAMTPYYWKTPRDGAARLAALPELTTDIAFRFLVFEKE